jgi:hypothetical protein
MELFILPKGTAVLAPMYMDTGAWVYPAICMASDPTTFIRVFLFMAAGL